MPKTVEEIKAEVTALVKSQGNQGAISLGTVLDDITELAGEGGGGGGGSTPNVISLSTADNVNFTIDNPDDLETFAEKAEQGECVVVRMSGPDLSSAGYTVAKHLKTPSFSIFTMSETSATNAGVTTSLISIDVDSQTVTTSTTTYPS